MTNEIVRRVDRVMVRAHDPDNLFNILTQQLLLRSAWPLATNPFYTSGGVHLGNLNLEIIQVGQTHRAQLYGIAFELASFENSLPELERRGIPHTPPQPFLQVDDQGWQVITHTNVYLGGLLDRHPASRLFFNLSRVAPSRTWERATLPTTFNRRYSLPFLYDNVYRQGMVVGVQHNPAWYKFNIREEKEYAGLELKERLRNFDRLE